MRTRALILFPVALAALVVISLVSARSHWTRLFEPHPPSNGLSHDEWEEHHADAYRKPFDGFVVGGATRSTLHMPQDERLRRAQALREAGDWYGLIEELETVTTLYPTFHEAQVYLAEAHLRRGRPSDIAESLTIAEKAASLEPDDWRVFAVKADAEARSGRVDAALRSLERAVDLDPKAAAEYATGSMDLQLLRQDSRFEGVVAGGQ